MSNADNRDTAAMIYCVTIWLILTTGERDILTGVVRWIWSLVP